MKDLWDASDEEKEVKDAWDASSEEETEPEPTAKEKEGGNEVNVTLLRFILRPI